MHSTYPRRRLAALALALGLGFGSAVQAQSLKDLYEAARAYDATYISARALADSAQYKAAQADALGRPSAALNASAIASRLQIPQVNKLTGQNIGKITGDSNTAKASIDARYPLFNRSNDAVIEQAQKALLVAQADLETAEQDLIVRVTQAYFDALAAQDTLALVRTGKAATSEQLASAKRNFEVGTATITDTNEAQAKYDSIVATEIQARNDLDRRRTALMAIIGHMPRSLKRVGRGFDPTLPTPNSVDYWVDRAIRDNLSLRFSQANYDIATLEVDRAKAGHYPTVDLVASAVAQASTGSTTTDFSSNSRAQLLGLVLNVPIYTGGFVNSRVREAISLQDTARADLETAKRSAVTNAQDGFSGVNSAAAGVKAFEQAVASAEVALQSNILGQEVGIRTNLDVLIVQQNVFSARRDLANAYFQYLLAVLRLKSAIGSLNEQDLEELNRHLNG